MCEDWDTFLEFLSDINACLGFKKRKKETKNANKIKKYSHENICLRLCEDEGMQIALIFQNKRLGVIYIK